MRTLIFMSAALMLSACGDDRTDPDRCPIDYQEPVVVQSFSCSTSACPGFSPGDVIDPNDPSCPPRITADAMCGGEWVFACGDAGGPMARLTFDRTRQGTYVTMGRDGSLVCDCEFTFEAP